jgi:hypothetical protein
MRWALKLRMNQMKALVASGEATRKNFVTLKRLYAIEALLDAKCEEYPEAAIDFEGRATHRSDIEAEVRGGG